MGRFASHLKLVSEQTHPCPFTSLEYAFVDYARLTALANECSSDGSAFREAWHEELARSTSKFDEHYETSTKIMFDAVFDGTEEEYRPCHPALVTSDPRALVEIHMKNKGRDFVLNLFQAFKVLLQSASLNAEALHLALKKYDKRAAVAAKEAGQSAPKTGMMRELLPKLYASTTYHATGARSLSGELQIVRELLEEDEAAAEDEQRVAVEKSNNGVVVTVGKLSESAEALKEEEYKWFMDSVKGLGDKELASLVAHRGFHCEDDDSVARPIENSLSSFEYAWGAGIHLAECDVGATKDDKIIMAHDEDFARLALMSGKESTTVVKDLTLADIMRMPLKHGSRPPLLVDVLRSAMAIGEHAKLVIEIKPGNSEIVKPLMMLFSRHPALLCRVAVIMSFDSYVMQDIADSLTVANMPGTGGGGLGVIGEGTQDTSGLPVSGTRTSHQLRRTRARPIQPVSYGAANGSDGDGCSPNPKLLVLTAFAHSDDFPYLITSVKNDFEGLSDKLPMDNGIDGVYIEYEPEMLQPEGKEKMLRLAESYSVGVWMLKPRDPDVLSIAKTLVDECGVSYVNTDFHRDFFSS